MAWGVGVTMTVFQLVALYIYAIDPWFLRSGHLLFASALTFLLAPALARSPKGRPSLVDLLLIAVSAGSVAYIVWDFEELTMRAGSIPLTADVVVGGLAILALLEAARRVTGWALPIIASLFILYGLWGHSLPHPLYHRPYPFGRVVSVIFSTDGIFGIPLGASSVYVFLFVLFGALLQQAKADRFFIDLSLGAVGRFRGGPAKVSVISSALFGTVSGSAVANVMVDGVINIPLMKATGFPPYLAGAIEAVTSTGGQIMPPVMGAAAFLMADILGQPYGRIAFAAIGPALLYYVSNYFMIDFAAARTGARGLSRGELPVARQVLRDRGYLLLPVLFLLLAITVFNLSPLRGALWAGVAVLVLSWVRRATRVTPLGVLDAFSQAARGILDVALTCATAGIVVGVLSLTGLGLRFASLVATYAQGRLWLALFLTMIVTLILGMGMPTVAAYAITASTAAPALVQLGATPLAAHMFVFYFACISSITPPVALAAFAAASIAGANLWQVGIHATRVGVTGFIVPYMFVYGPALMFQAGWLESTWALVSGSIGVMALAGGIQGWLFGTVKWRARAALLAAALLLIKPGIYTDIAGAALLAAVLVLLRWRAPRPVRAPE
ncbi:MAG TPA: TRAP transporter fused permease subunit [Candidatus Methylomirabilis sp.]|jgi:TRAP transporter 4TM/12TM fusion protein